MPSRNRKYITGNRPILPHLNAQKVPNAWNRSVVPHWPSISIQHDVQSLHHLLPASVSALVTHYFTPFTLYFSIKEFNILNIWEHSIYTEPLLTSMAVFLLYFSEFSFLPSTLSCSQTIYSSLSMLPAASSSKDTVQLQCILLQLTEYPTKNSLNNTEFKTVCSVTQHPQAWCLIPPHRVARWLPQLRAPQLT